MVGKRFVPPESVVNPTPEQLQVLAMIRKRFSLTATRELADILDLLHPPSNLPLNDTVDATGNARKNRRAVRKTYGGSGSTYI
jgi:hypothetical protein